MRVENKRHTNAHQPLTSHSPMGVSIPPLSAVLGADRVTSFALGQLTEWTRNGHAGHSNVYAESTSKGQNLKANASRCNDLAARTTRMIICQVRFGTDGTEPYFLPRVRL
jgi:hypothetical protein